LKRKPTVRELAKVIGISDKKITEMYPKKGEEETLETSEKGETIDQPTGDETPS
jgi:hypothetical protein